MTNEDKFIGFEFNQNEYEAEAREKWGNKTVDKANNRINSWSKEEKALKEEEMNDIFRAFAANRNESPDSEIAQSIVQRWYTYLNSNIDCEYSLEAFGSIGDMYVSDERFTKNINKFGEGTAQFASKAIASYVKMNQ